MHRRQPLPRLWVMTDARQGERLWIALKRLPRGGGVVFRHYHLSVDERRNLFGRVRRIARMRQLTLLLAGPPYLARAWGADGSHGRHRSRQGLSSAPAHNLGQIRAAERGGADILFLSPVFPTRSHPGAAALGPLRFAMLRRQTRLPVVALGGLTPMRGRRMRALGAYGWAAIDAWAD